MSSGTAFRGAAAQLTRIFSLPITPKSAKCFRTSSRFSSSAKYTTRPRFVVLPRNFLPRATRTATCRARVDLPVFGFAAKREMRQLGSRPSIGPRNFSLWLTQKVMRSCQTKAISRRIRFLPAFNLFCCQHRRLFHQFMELFCASAELFPFRQVLACW